ncbi:DUF805 domain-containing protein [Aliifodinibius sp. S!AR15-10]|uniref:DUF805 domain-containing protein n=1 Tax=Aliifodinibius sp. S!AR15-10 TaxID=2950437 RepID=UPI00285B5BB2|nr:DUF805 domain-containing protein [Aliifodinibius sp. S!AR15-10]MDR8392577.1 DUF805 domain-containing protein [Aliifodinibius sp. S!AR15-10]
MYWYLKVLQNYANFNGRAHRREYWMFFLLNMIFSLSAAILDNILGLAFGGVGYGPLYILYALALFIPGVAVMVRRLHDLGLSAWFMLIGLIPFFGAIVLLIMMAIDGDSGENKYGMSPKGADG